MKKKTIATMLAFCLLLGLSACDNAKTPQDTKAPADSNSADASAENLPDLSADRPDYSYSETVLTDYERNQNCERSYDLYLLNDSVASLLVTSVYDAYQQSTFQYVGSYKIEEDHVLFTYVDNGTWTYHYSFELSDGEITQVISYSDDFSEIAGSYTREDEYYGTMLLTITYTGDAVLDTENAGSYIGSVFNYDGRYDLVVSQDSEDNYDNIDCFIDLQSDGSFTYEDFYYASGYSIEGIIEADGELGTLRFECAAGGNVTAEIPYEGQNLHMYGSYYVTEEQDGIQSISLSSDEGYSIYLELVKFDDGTLNYSGSITIPLAAG